MNTETYNLLFALLRCAICGEAFSENEKKHYSDDEISCLISVASRHDILPIVAYAVKKNGLLFSAELGEKLEKSVLNAVLRQETQDYELKRICKLFEEAEIPFIPMKGSVIRQYYPEPWMRTSCDIDILVPKSCTEQAMKCMCDVGFVRTNDATLHNYSLFSPSNVHIELHFTIAQQRLRVANSTLEQTWENSAPAETGRYRYSMSPEFFMFYHIAHMAKHIINGGCGIRPFIDLWILENYFPYDKARLQSLLFENGLAEVYAQASLLSRVWLENAEPSSRLKQFESYILSGGVYGTTQNTAKIKAARGESKIQSFFKMMFLSKDSLAVLYPNLNNHPSLFAFYQVKRWFRIFRKGHRDNIKNLAQARNGVTEEAVSSAQELLEYLGLY